MASTASTQIPRPPQPPEPALLNTSNLELLATHEKHRVQEFVASQTRYTKAHANEGRAVHASWDISTPEKDRMRLHQLSAGFETPVLRPRAAQIRAKPNNPPASPPRLKSPANKPTTQKKSIAKKSGTLNPTRKERARSDTDEEHLARLTERRERKRARREIMNAREDTRGGKENKKDARDEPNDKRKQRIPAGLALMHGFSSASVGKSRLTIEPPPNFGVFNKGRASAKIKVNQSKRTKQRGFRSHIFSEDRFLDTRLAKSPDERLDPQTSSGRNISNEPSSPAKMKKSTGTHLQKKTPIKMKGAVGRCHSAASMQSDSDTANSVTSRIVGMRGAKQTDQYEPMESRSPARSISWAIERDGLSLPSTTSDVAVASVKSKSETALLDVRAAAWSKFLKDDLPGDKAPFTSEPHENPRAISIFPATTTLQRVTSNAHLELEELATIGPWESVSQVARSTLRPQEPGSMHSRYFALPHNGESGFSQPMTHLVNDPLGQPTSIDDERSNNAGDTTIDGPLDHGETGGDHRGEDMSPPSAPALSGNKTFALPEGRFLANQTSSLDLVDSALFLDVPKVTRRRSRIRRGPAPWHEYNSTAENMFFQQYGLDPTESRCEVSRHNKHADASKSLVDATILGNMQDNALNFRGEDNAEGLEGDSRDQVWRDEWYPDIISDSQFVTDVGDTLPNAAYDCRDGAPFLLGEQDPDYDGVNESEEDRTGFASVSMPSTNWSVFPDDDADEMTNIHLWNDEARARGDAAGGNDLQEGCSHLTTVQKVEQDVAKKLKGHWFPHKF